MRPPAAGMTRRNIRHDITRGRISLRRGYENNLSANRVLKAGIGIGQYSNSCAPNWATQTILGALQRYRLGPVTDTRLFTMSAFLVVDYPLANRLYPGSLDAIEHVRRWGLTVILSDGDVVFQPRKVQRSRLWDAVEGRVLIYIHKEQMLDAVAARYPARRYVMIDDKLRILTAMKTAWGDRLRTIFPRQGHYALDASDVARYPPADMTVERIGELVDADAGALLGQEAGKRTGRTA